MEWGDTADFQSLCDARRVKHRLSETTHTKFLCGRSIQTLAPKEHIGRRT